MRSPSAPEQRRPRRPIATLVLWAVLPVATLPFSATPGRAEDASAPSGAPHAPALGRPAEADAVALRLEAAGEHGVEAEVELTRELAAAGGLHAAEALGRLARSPSSTVRTAAFAAARQVDLRARSLLSAARSGVESAVPEEAIAALGVLGALGEGKDVPLLLDRAGQGPPAVRQAAFRALGERLGVRGPYQVAYWQRVWDDVRLRAQVLLPVALAAVEDHPDTPEVTAPRTILEALGWISTDQVDAALDRWFLARDPALRGEACRLAARLRRVDLAPRVRDVRRYDARGVLEEVTRDALDALGVPSAERQ